MTKRRIGIWLAAVLCVLAAASASGQTVSSLQEEIRRAQEDIDRSTLLLKQTQSQRTVNSRELGLLLSRMDSRRKLVSSLQQKIEILEGDIAMRTGDIEALRARRDELRAEYARIIRQSYKNYKLNNFMLLLFGSRDFNDASRRLDFMRRYSRRMELKAGELDSLARVLRVEVEVLDARKAEITGTRNTHDREIASMRSDQRQYETAAGRLAASGKRITKELADKRAAVKRAQDRIAQIIEQENRRAAQNQTAQQRQAAIELSSRFDQNRGKLPHPLAGGVIVDRFGLHTDPHNPDIKIDNSGVDIAGSAGARVSSVFEGEVSSIHLLQEQGYGYVVAVRHGNYVTVYAKLDRVAVKVGDKVATGQALGNIASGGNSQDHVLHFEIWQGRTKLNPQLWLR